MYYRPPALRASCMCHAGFFSPFSSAMVISNEKKYGSIGIIFALLAHLIAIGVVVVLGAAVGLIW
jgi:membrane protein